MAEQTSDTETLSREDLAAYLQALSEEFTADGTVDVQVGNKTVSLQPPAQIDCTTDITEETGGMLSDAQETIQLTMRWTPQETEE